jgi:hypothetical protein
MRARTTTRRLSALAILGLTLIGGCPPPADAPEPNDSAPPATPPPPRVAVEAPPLQGNPHAFPIPLAAGGVLHFAAQTLDVEEESCAAFAVLAPDGTILYDDNLTSCSRGLAEPTQVDGASLAHQPGAGYDLRVPAAQAGTYVLTVRVLGYADNLFTYSWHYRLTATQE